MKGLHVMKDLEWSGVAARLKALRKQHKLTIERLAEMIKVSTSFIGLIEKGESGISLENLYKLSQVFSCSIDFLITGEEQNAAAIAANTNPNLVMLTAALCDYTSEEIEFLVSLAGFLRNKVKIK